MESKFILVLFFGFLLLQSCNPQETKSLLTTFEICSDNCTTAEQTQIEGDLSIDPENSQMSFNVDKGNLIEISGTCKDLGRKNNRIIVNAFENEEDESVLPYVDNTISSLCQKPVLGMAITQQCIFVTHGKGLTESGQVYPQCINGRFSFMVRLGNVSKVVAVVKNYLIRMKLRTTDGLTSESGWARTAIKREVSVPNFTLTTDTTNFRCEVKTEGFKFKHAPFASVPDNIPDITYMVKRDSTGFTNAGATLIIPAPPLPPANRFTGFQSYSDMTQVNAGDAVANYWDTGLNNKVVLSEILASGPQPGVKYNYYVQASAGTDESAVSSPKVCEMPAPFIGVVSITLPNCTATITTGGNSIFDYHWQYGLSGGWTGSQAGGSGFAVPIFAPFNTVCSYVSRGNCAFDMTSLPTGSYFLAVRTYDIATGTFGKWSNEVLCKK